MEVNQYLKDVDLDAFCSDMPKGIRGQFYAHLLGHANNLIERRAVDVGEVTVKEAKLPRKRKTPNHVFHLATILVNQIPDSEIWVKYSQFHDGTEYVPLDDRLESMRLSIKLV